ncbi:phenylalanine--tRNA ligase subunit beta [Fibrobacter sp. UWP2]|uniref:phenylalanine--tRNA ligase subunit beta n=1 Tax=Fibrobacter sp. UWP2 TaxID=1896216 RepID=UPI000918D89C|nr:phenylalanine--tRNA ligase subunit beta [Fibrobacter sp. UWP2]SHI29991.1 phenylalanyl-tRNA synthetase beta subunit [Fibrobacter sp. UWP2]
MKVSLNWLRRHVDLPESAEEVAKALTSIGLEVEGMEEPGKVYDKLIVAKVLTCEPHPDSDHLHITTVNDGKETLQVVCGAPNVAAGQTVVLAPIGAELPLPDGTKLKMKKSKIRGVESFGMICAEDEIGLSDDHAGIMVLDDSIPAGTPFVSLGMYDVCYELNVTPNRPDALSHRGVARELAAKFNRPLKPLQYELKEDAEAASSAISLEVVPGCGCTRYVGRVIKDVKVEKSPAWLAKLLHAVGMNSINNVVDVTNFILMDVGQPLHSFDMDQLNGKTIKVRRAVKGEKIETIDHTAHELLESDLVICDGDRPACVAGVMGGVESEIVDATKNVFLESAWFNPTIVRKQSKRLCITTDSSYRFEREIDFCTQDEYSRYACAMIQELAGGRILKGSVEYTGDDHKKELDQVTLRTERAAKVIGMEVTTEQIEKLLTGICLEVITKDADSITFRIPSFRPDLTREVDLIEEIARLIGFDNIPYSLPKFTMQPNELPAIEVLNRKIRKTLSAMGLHECLSLRFTSKARTEALFGAANDADKRSMPALLLNPLSEELGAVPTSLLPNLLKAVAENEKNRPGNIRLFEVAKGQFKRDRKDVRDPGFDESNLVAIAVAGAFDVDPLNDKPKQIDFASFKGLVVSFFKRLGFVVEIRVPQKLEVFLHPGKQAEVLVNGNSVATFGALHPSAMAANEITYDTYVLEADMDKLVKESHKKIVFQPFSRQVPSSRDISIEVTKAMTHEEVLARIKSFNPKNLAKITLKSIYEGEKIEAGKKNMVYSLVYQAMDRTLTDDEVNKAHNKLREKLVQNGDIVLR